MLVMSRKDEIYKPALAGKKIPILTLDNKWHKLFTQKKPDKKLRRLEEELNELLKKQGKLTSEIKDIKKLKKKYKILKIKYFLLFVLPIFLVVLAFQTAKQLLYIKTREL